jgi:hypothetical protein
MKGPPRRDLRLPSAGADRGYGCGTTPPCVRSQPNRRPRRVDVGVRRRLANCGWAFIGGGGATMGSLWTSGLSLAWLVSYWGFSSCSSASCSSCGFRTSSPPPSPRTSTAIGDTGASASSSSTPGTAASTRSACRGVASGDRTSQSEHGIRPFADPRSAPARLWRGRPRALARGRSRGSPRRSVRNFRSPA